MLTGLNVFNTAFVLAKPETATDTDYERIEGVVAHEYFHNWTGNRVTCRDWFQLTLKEGLTVFRDQQFSSDMGSAAVKRIEDVRSLRSRQFPEDSGPRAHAIRPESYMKMVSNKCWFVAFHFGVPMILLFTSFYACMCQDNFYTATVYEKGAEVIRMYHTLLGPEGFRKGMDLYFKRHDGNAVTCDDFRAAMADANNMEFTQFERWYLQAGTPTVEVKTDFNPATKTYKMTFTQKTLPTVGQPTKLPFHIPIRVGLLGKDGKELVASHVLELKSESQAWAYEGLDEEPVPSVLRGFSAPVKIKMEQSDDDLAFLMAHDTDSFNRWEASQKLASKAILSLTDDLVQGKEPGPLAPAMVEAFRTVLKANSNPSIDKSLLAYALTLPDETTLLGEMDVMRPKALHRARDYVREYLTKALWDEFMQVYKALDVVKPTYEVTPAEIGRRRLKNVCLSYLSTSRDPQVVSLCLQAFNQAKCMTDSVAALNCLASLPGPERVQALKTFYDKAKGDQLVLNKWFSIQAMADLPDTLDQVEALMAHPDFSLKNPNRVRALVGAFANMNLAHFHRDDGRGYQLVGDVVQKVDQINPLVSK